MTLRVIHSQICHASLFLCMYLDLFKFMSMNLTAKSYPDCFETISNSKS